MNKLRKIFILLLGVMASMQIQAQDKIVNPDISYAGTPRTLKLGGINVSGVEGYEDYVLTGISGLTVGDEITVPGDDITTAVMSSPGTVISSPTVSPEIPVST